MACTVRTRYRGEDPNVMLDEVTWSYLTCRKALGETLLDFLRRYEACWRSVHLYGEIGYDGILRLICCLPPQWKNWATQMAKSFIGHRRSTAGRKGNMRGFIFAMRDTIRSRLDGPPPTPIIHSLWPSKGKRVRAEEGESSQTLKGKRISVRADSEDELDLKEEVERYYLRDADFEAMVYQADEKREEEEEDPEEEPEEEDPEEEDPDEAMGEQPVDELITHLPQESQFEITPPISSSDVEELEPPPRQLGPIINIDNVRTGPQEQPVLIYFDSSDKD